MYIITKNLILVFIIYNVIKYQFDEYFINNNMRDHRSFYLLLELMYQNQAIIDRISFICCFY